VISLDKGPKENAPARQSAGRSIKLLVKAFWLGALGFFPVLTDEFLSRLSEGLDYVLLADATLLSHHDDGLGLGCLTGFDLDSLNACEFLERRTDAPLTSGSSDTREGGLVFDVRTIGDAQQHNRQKGDEVMYFHCSRTDGVVHPPISYV